MRLERLELARYGAFDALSLDLSRPGVLHVIYGQNEAGKSTTRRAIGDLLYGIASDTYSPAPEELSATGTLSADGVPSVTVTRRKGRKNTLVYPGGAPCPEGVLAPFVGTIDRATFEIMFGLDHDSLRVGGEAILRGEGDIGETLFEAGSGLVHVTELGKALRAAHEEIYAPRAVKRRLNVAIAQVKKQQQAVRQAILTTDAYQDQERGVIDAQAKIAALDAERTSLEAELARKKRVAQVLPLLAERTRWLERERALGDVVLLPHEAAQERVAAEDNARRASARIAGLELDIAAHARMEEAAVFSPAIAGAVERIGGLAGDLGTLAHDERELVRARAELTRLPEVTADEVDAVRALSLALDDIEGEGGIDLALEEARVAAAAERCACADAIVSLGLACAPEDMPRMAFVPLDTVRIHEEKIRAQDERTRALDAALVRAEEAVAAADAQLAEALAAGDLPDETVLFKLRLERDLAVQDLIEKGSSYAARAERAISAADDLADRLLRDAARVAARARAQAAVKTAADERRAAARRFDEAQKEALRARAAGGSLAAAAGMPALEPAAARERD